MENQQSVSEYLSDRKYKLDNGKILLEEIIKLPKGIDIKFPKSILVSENYILNNFTVITIVGDDSLDLKNEALYYLLENINEKSIWKIVNNFNYPSIFNKISIIRSIKSSLIYCLSNFREDTNKICLDATRHWSCKSFFLMKISDFLNTDSEYILTATEYEAKNYLDYVNSELKNYVEILSEKFKYIDSSKIYIYDLNESIIRELDVFPENVEYHLTNFIILPGKFSGILLNEVLVSKLMKVTLADMEKLMKSSKSTIYKKVGRHSIRHDNYLKLTAKNVRKNINTKVVVVKDEIPVLKNLLIQLVSI